MVALVLPLDLASFAAMSIATDLNRLVELLPRGCNDTRRSPGDKSDDRPPNMAGECDPLEWVIRC